MLGNRINVIVVTRSRQANADVNRARLKFE
jgi:hypothetical protein